MDPNNQPTNPVTPLPGTSPTAGPVAPKNDFDKGGNKGNRTRKIVFIAAGAVMLILAIIGIVASLSSGGSNSRESQDNASVAQPPDLTRVPTSIDIENINNSISSSITGLDDTKDFPEINLNDDSLQL